MSRPPPRRRPLALVLTAGLAASGAAAPLNHGPTVSFDSVLGEYRRRDRVVIVVQVDGLTAARAGLAPTPTLDELATRGGAGEIYGPGPGLPGLVTATSGTPPTTHGVRADHWRPWMGSRPLPEALSRLHENRTATTVIGTRPGLRRVLGPSASNRVVVLKPGSRRAGAAATRVLTRAGEALRTGRRGVFFLSVRDLGDRVATGSSPAGPGAAVAALDASLAALRKTLRDLGLGAESTLIVYGTGDAAGAAGGLWAAGPGVAPGTRLGARALTDVAPTVLGLLGAEVPAYLPGDTLFAGSVRPGPGGSPGHPPGQAD